LTGQRAQTTLAAIQAGGDATTVATAGENMKRRILLVEDDDLNRDMLSRRLALENYDVIEAVDGLEALALARSESPDLILMDVNLPRMDGWQATRQLKDDETTRATPIVMLTAHAMKGDDQRCLDAGCDAYQTKPIDWAQLMSCLETLLNRKGPVDGIPFAAGCR
jgi:CheY-like chemotaxis protein